MKLSRPTIVPLYTEGLPLDLAPMRRYMQVLGDLATIEYDRRERWSYLKQELDDSQMRWWKLRILIGYDKWLKRGGKRKRIIKYKLQAVK